MEFIVEIVIGIFSILLSIWFYWLAKKSEKRSEEILSKIDAQVVNIKEINTRWLDKSMTYFTEMKPVNIMDELPKFSKFLEEMKNIVTLEKEKKLDGKNVDYNKAFKDTLSIDVLSYFFMYSGNYYTQAFLASNPIRGNESKPVLETIKTAYVFLDVSHKYFRAYDELLKAYPKDVVESEYSGIYQAIIKNQNVIKDSKSFKEFYDNTVINFKN